MNSKLSLIVAVVFFIKATVSALTVTHLNTEWLKNPQGIDATQPRLSWQLEAKERGASQTAFQILVAGQASLLQQDQGDLWDSGKVTSQETLNHVYIGKPLRSGQSCFWKVRVWDEKGQASAWSETAHWSMGLLKSGDWKAQWISHRDTTPLHKDRTALHLPPARHFRKSFSAEKSIRQATLHFSALGIANCFVNGKPVGDAYFESGWADYHKRAYYRTHDVTHLIRDGGNTVGAILADGWYSGYVGYGLLVGYGPKKTGRSFYGKTPALLAQLEIEYSDGSKTVIATDKSWQTSGSGPYREADMIMGEFFDARLDRTDWCTSSGAADWEWEPVIRAGDNGRIKAIYSDTMGDREVDLGFNSPKVMQAYSAPPIRIIQEQPAQQMTEKGGKYIFNLGQNIAGVIRLKVKGPAGTKVTMRYGEMLHPDGRLMTENLRKARATDFYILKGDENGEEWIPRFTYHGFQYVELSGLPQKPNLGAVTGLVLHNDTPLGGSFSCSDPVMTQFAKNAVWTQRANYIEVPTDCPQRDERLGWMGDAQAYVRTASYYADIAAFFTKWLDDVEEAQRDFGAYPDYCPYPMTHGQPRKSFGTAWTDAGIICPWTIWQVYGDTRVIERHWNSMTRFMNFRAATTTPDGLGTSIGNPWGDWLNVNENTPIEYIDTCYHALDCRKMAEMAEALGRSVEAKNYRQRFETIKSVYNKAYVNSDGTLKVNTQTAYVLALEFDLLPAKLVNAAASRLVEKIAQNENRMATGFLGTRSLLLALSRGGQHDLAVRLFQSRKFPSWGYEVINGANTVWERWDSYTKEDGFGRHNASMNSYSHYAFGAVMEWAFRNLGGIDTDGPGYAKLVIRPGPPSVASNPDNAPISWVNAEYHSPRGKVVSDWKTENGQFVLKVTIPANVIATVYIPAKSETMVREGGKPLKETTGVKVLRQEGARLILGVQSGEYLFQSDLGAETPAK